VGGGALLLARDLWTTDLDDPKSCLHAVRVCRKFNLPQVLTLNQFERNGFVIGPVVWVGCLLDYLL
jgi:4-hydroxybenzoate polyprenyltransferase